MSLTGVKPALSGREPGCLSLADRDEYGGPERIQTVVVLLDREAHYLYATDPKTICNSPGDIGKEPVSAYEARVPAFPQLQKLVAWVGIEPTDF